MDGLDKFRKSFIDYADNYVIIGGTAFNLCMKGSGMDARSTHDIDMIVVVEKMTDKFGSQFWQFVKDGEY